MNNLKLLLFFLLLTISIACVEGKSKDAKLEEYRQWAQEQLDKIAADLRLKGLTGYSQGVGADQPVDGEGEITEDTSSSSNSGGLSEYEQVRKKRSTEELGRLSVKRDLQQQDSDHPNIQTLGGETRYWSMKRRATRRLVPVNNPTVQTKNYPDTEEVMVKDYEKTGSEHNPLSIEETPADKEISPLDVNVSANTMMGSENEPFQKPLHETVDLPDETLPVSLLDELSQMKRYKKRKEGKVAHVLRSIVKPFLPPDDPPRSNARFQNTFERRW
jgi:hypothetical protein